MRIKAALYNADHLEYGLVTIPFPIPQDQYNDTIKMLEALDIGDPRAKDCMVEEIEGYVPSLKCLEGHRINVDELDYLVKRLDSFSDGELVQFSVGSINSFVVPDSGPAPTGSGDPGRCTRSLFWPPGWLFAACSPAPGLHRTNAPRRGTIL